MDDKQDTSGVTSGYKSPRDLDYRKLARMMLDNLEPDNKIIAALLNPSSASESFNLDDVSVIDGAD